jgi:two-component system LytT family response regulator
MTPPMTPNITKLRLLIVDDEPLIRSGLRKELAKFAELEIAGECADGKSAIAAITAQKPDLVLLDVQLGDCTGLDVVREIGSERMPMVIFLTAYDEYAVKAFELNAVDYVLKPFDEDRLRQSLGRATERWSERQAAKTQATLAAHLQSLLAGASASSAAWPERLVVRDGERFEFVPVESLDWVESANNYVQLHCGAKTHLMLETLSGLEKKLDPHKFVRIHRGRIVNVSRVRAAHAIMNGVYELELHSGRKLATGRQFRAAVQKLMRK